MKTDPKTAKEFCKYWREKAKTDPYGYFELGYFATLSDKIDYRRVMFSSIVGSYPSSLVPAQDLNSFVENLLSSRKSK
jgi:hypothetical protein